MTTRAKSKKVSWPCCLSLGGSNGDEPEEAKYVICIEREKKEENRHGLLAPIRATRPTPDHRTTQTADTGPKLPTVNIVDPIALVILALATHPLVACKLGLARNVVVGPLETHSGVNITDGSTNLFLLGFR